MNILEKVLDLMQSDDCNTDKQSTILEDIYADADDTQKQILDWVFIALCGYSLMTLITNKD